MTRGISEERLRALKALGSIAFEHFIDILLQTECNELNPWLPIESAPKDRPILLFMPDCYGWEVGKWIDRTNKWSCYPYQPTHYQELPCDPE